MQGSVGTRLKFWAWGKRSVNSGAFCLFTLSGQILKCDSEAFADDLHVIPCSFAFVLMCTIRK